MSLLLHKQRTESFCKQQLEFFKCLDVNVYIPKLGNIDLKKSSRQGNA